MFRKVLAVPALVLLTAATASATPFQNGSFELSANPQPPAGSFSTLGVGSTLITGWQVFGNQGYTIDYINGYWQAADGARSLDLNGNGGPDGGVFQQFDTVAGTTYAVQFALAGNPDGPPTVNTVNAGVNNLAFGQLFVFNEPGGTTRADMNWQYYSFQFTATGPLTAVFFQSLTPSQFFGPALDDVSISTVPEPATMTLIGLGLAGAAIRRRKGSR